MIRIDKWVGLVTNASPYALPPGAAVEQVNVQCIVPGQVTVRPGLQSVTFSAAVSNSQPIVRAFRYQHGSGEHIVYQAADGSIYSSVVGASAVATPPSPPSPPAISFAQPGVLSMQVTVSPPAQAGTSPVTGYVFQVSADAGFTWTAAGSSTTATATLTGLEGGVGYRVRAAAVNRSGQGDYGDSYGTVTPFSAVVSVPPSPPTGVTAVAGAAIATVRWTPPTSAGTNPITGYAVQQSSNNGASWVNSGTAATAVFEAQSLAANTDYIFRVASISSAGTSAYSAASAPITILLNASPPSAPQNVRLAAGGVTTTSVALQWDAPSSAGSCAIEGYLLFVKLASSSTWPQQSTDSVGVSTSYTKSGLTSGTAYDFMVKAVNCWGAGPESQTVRASTPSLQPTVPGVPTNFAVSIGPDSFYSASWLAPASNGGSAVTGYKLEVGASQGGPWTVLKESAEGPWTGSYAFVKGSTYWFRVAAKNSVGYGPYQATGSDGYLIAVRFITPPGACTALAVAYPAGTPAHTLTVSWAPPADTGGAGITYMLLYKDSNGGELFSGVGTPSTLPDGRITHSTAFAYGTSGTFEVRAVNGVAAPGPAATISFSVPQPSATYKSPTIEAVYVRDADGNEIFTQAKISVALAAAESPANAAALAAGTTRWRVEVKGSAPSFAHSIAIGRDDDGYSGLFTYGMPPYEQSGRYYFRAAIFSSSGAEQLSPWAWDEITLSQNI